MDNLKTLFNKKNYQLIIDLTKDVTSDFDALYYRINSLIELNDYKEALKTLNNPLARNTMYNASPFTFMKLHLGLFIHEKRYMEAIKMFEEYKQKPYISQEVEEFLNSVDQVINKKINDDIKTSLNNSEESIIKTLSTSKNNEVLIATIYNLRKLEITPFVLTLKSLINKDYIRDDVKTLIILTFKDKKCDFEVSFSKNNINYTINPMHLFTPFIGKEYEEVLKYIYQFSKDPSIENIAKDILSQYILMIYPEGIFDLNPKIFASSLILIANEYLKIEDKNLNFIDAYKLDFNKIKDLSKSIIKRIEIK